MKYVNNTNCCFGMIDAELVEKRIKKINAVNKIQSRIKFVKSGGSRHFANMD